MSETEKNRYFSRLKRGTKLEKILCFISAVSLLTITIMVALLAYFGYHYNNNLGLKNIDQSNVCITPGCVKAASVVLSNIDETIDPCNDFFRFACGQWLKTHTIPEDKSYLSIDQEIDDRLKLRLKELLEAELDGTEPRFIRILKDVYDACMDEKSIEKAGAEPLKKLLKSLGGWPVVEGKNWNERKFDWVETMISLPKQGPTLLCYVDADRRNSSRNIIYLEEALLGMPDREYLIKGLNESETAAYFKKMVKAANLLGADTKIAEEELLEVLQFEMTLANYTLPEEEKHNISKQYNKYSIKQLQKMIPEVPWLKYFNGILKNEVNENEMVILLFPEYVKKLVALIERTEKR